MNPLKSQLDILYFKLRHRRGHGIHSPFVYSFIENIIDNKLPFYAFQDIENHIQNVLSTPYHSKKIDKLIFRIINHFHLRKILIIGMKNAEQALYASAPSHSTECTCVEKNISRRDLASRLKDIWPRKISIGDSIPEESVHYDCIIIDIKYLYRYSISLDELIQRSIHEKSVIILTNLRTKSMENSFFEKNIQDERIRISLDLYKVGILFFDKKYYKRNYTLSY